MLEAVGFSNFNWNSLGVISSPVVDESWGTRSWSSWLLAESLEDSLCWASLLFLVFCFRALFDPFLFGFLVDPKVVYWASILLKFIFSLSWKLFSDFGVSYFAFWRFWSSDSKLASRCAVLKKLFEFSTFKLSGFSNDYAFCKVKAYPIPRLYRFSSVVLSLKGSLYSTEAMKLLVTSDGISECKATSGC